MKKRQVKPCPFLCVVYPGILSAPARAWIRTNDPAKNKQSVAGNIHAPVFRPGRGDITVARNDLGPLLVRILPEFIGADAVIEPSEQQHAAPGLVIGEGGVYARRSCWGGQVLPSAIFPAPELVYGLA